MGKDAPQPREIKSGRLVDRFGAPAVYGRPLGYGEMRQIMLAERVEFVCRKWLGPDAGQWFTKNPDDAAVFEWAKKAFVNGTSRG